MQQIKGFWNKNKVFILGLIGAIWIAGQDLFLKPNVDYKVLGYAVLLAVLSYFAKEWRGQTASITGIVGNVCAISVTLLTNNTFSWQQLVIQVLGLYITAIIPDQKSRGYEYAENIVKAKIQGEEINPAALTVKPTVEAIGDPPKLQPVR